MDHFRSVPPSPVYSTDRDKMFQATSSMPTSLSELATKGWTVIAAALLGTEGKPPLWTQEGCRPVIGTTIECRMTPCPVSHKEESLLLSMWWPARDLDTLESHKSFLKGFEPQGVIIFTEPHSELNAGLVVICASRHSPIVDLGPLDMPVATRAENDGLVEKLAADAILGYQRLAQRYVSSAQDPESLSCEEGSKWIQTLLTLDTLLTGPLRGP